MALEDLTGLGKFLGDLVRTNPDGANDIIAFGDNHLRGIKNVLLNTFPNLAEAMTLTAAQLNALEFAADNAGIIAYRDTLLQVDLNSELLGGLTLGEVLTEARMRDTHTGTQPPSTIEPQGEGSGLDADLLRGLTAEDLSDISSRTIAVPEMFFNTGRGILGDVTISGTDTLTNGVHEYENLTIPAGAVLRPSTSNSHLFIRVKGTFTCAGTLDVSGRGGIGGAEANEPGGDGQGDGVSAAGVGLRRNSAGLLSGRYLGGSGGSGKDQNTTGSDGRAGHSRYYLTPSAPESDGTGWGTTPDHFNLQDALNAWTPTFTGGAGGGGSLGGDDSAGGNGGGLVVIVAENFNFTGTINARGRENLNRTGDVDLEDSGVGGGGVILTFARNVVSNSGSRLITAPVPSGFGDGDTTVGGRGLNFHHDFG